MSFYHLKNRSGRVNISKGQNAVRLRNGQIYLFSRELEKGREYNSERRWINTVYHEMGHYIFWADAENKADMFASRIVRGLNHHK